MPNPPPPLYLLAGGHPQQPRPGPDPLMQAALRQTGIARPMVAYIGAASGDNAAFRLHIGNLLEQAGAGQVLLAPLCGARADPEKAKTILEAADVVFVSGGDVEEGMRVLREQGMVSVLGSLYRQGVPFIGVSAGSIMLADRWVRWTDPDDDGSAELFPCLGFAPVLCDTHGEGPKPETRTPNGCGPEEGWEELRAALTVSPPGTVGYGIVSGTALVVEPGGRVSALGGEAHVFRRETAGVVQLPNLGAT